MSELLKINVSDHIEKKNGLTYLSWAWAWAEVLKIDPGARWHTVEYGNERGCAMPCMYLPDGSAMVKVEVTINGETKQSILPVMDHRNKAIQNPDAFAINKNIMRCLAKAISMHGLGLYIYAGEDLPEGEPEPKKAPIIPATPRNSDLDVTEEDLVYLNEFAIEITEVVKTNAVGALASINAAGLDNDQRIALSNMLDSKTRSALKKAKEVATA
jgi:hypothetical protein